MVEVILVAHHLDQMWRSRGMMDGLKLWTWCIWYTLFELTFPFLVLDETDSQDLLPARKLQSFNAAKVTPCGLQQMKYVSFPECSKWENLVETPCGDKGNIQCLHTSLVVLYQNQKPRVIRSCKPLNHCLFDGHVNATQYVCQLVDHHAFMISPPVPYHVQVCTNRVVLKITFLLGNYGYAMFTMEQNNHHHFYITNQNHVWILSRGKCLKNQPKAQEKILWLALSSLDVSSFPIMQKSANWFSTQGMKMYAANIPARVLAELCLFCTAITCKHCSQNDFTTHR